MNAVIVKGPTTLTNGTKGVVTQVYNNGELGLFKADNGPVFTIKTTDLLAKQPALSANAIIAELHRIFNTPLRADLKWF
jgi:hypothetical protein